MLKTFLLCYCSFVYGSGLKEFLELTVLNFDTLKKYHKDYKKIILINTIAYIFEPVLIIVYMVGKLFEGALELFVEDI